MMMKMIGEALWAIGSVSFVVWSVALMMLAVRVRRHQLAANLPLPEQRTVAFLRLAWQITELRPLFWFMAGAFSITALAVIVTTILAVIKLLGHEL